MTIKEALTKATKKLQNKSTSPGLDAEVLLSFVLKKPKEYLAVRTHQYVPQNLKREFFKLIKKRLEGWPVAYLTNNKEFFGLDFYVDKNVLIPRPETEGLVELVLEKIKNKSGLKILDVGTGTGCIIISLAKSLFSNSRELDHRYFASDVSIKALSIAKKNAKFHKTKITFKPGSLLEPWKNQSFDVIVANLPYLTKRTDRSTRIEPTKALIAKNKGLALYEQLFREVALCVIPAFAGIQTKSFVSGSPIESGMIKLPSFIFLEIGHDQEPAIKKLAEKYLPAFETKISKDLFGRIRYAALTLK